MTAPHATLSAPDFRAIELPGGATLFARQDDRFQSQVARAVFHTPASADATAIALLPSLLMRGTRSFPSQARIAARLEELYGGRIGLSVTKRGERLVLSASLWTLADRAVPVDSESAFDAGLDMLGEVLWSPAFAESAPPSPEARFPLEVLSQERDQLRRRLLALPHDKFTYGYVRLFETLGRGGPVGVSPHGDADALETLAHGDIVSAWWRLTRSEPLMLFVVGPQPVEALADRVRDRLGVLLSARTPRTLDPLHACTSTAQPREARESLGGEQAHAFLAFRTHCGVADDDFDTLVVLDAVLGGYAFSRLFQEVRERQGLAYDVGTFIEPHFGLLIAHAGLERDGVEACLAAVDAQIAVVQAGTFSDEEWTRALATLADEYRRIPESRDAWISFAASRALAGVSAHPDAVAERIHRVTRDQVVALAGRLERDTTFILD